MSQREGPGNHRVEPGQPISQAFSATGWNRAQDAADIVLKSNGGISAAKAGPPLDSNMIFAKIDASTNYVVRPGSWVFMNLGGAGDLDAKQTTNSIQSTMFATPIAHNATSRPTPTDSATRYKNQLFGMARTAGEAGDIIKVQISGAVYCHIIVRHRWHGFVRFPFGLLGRVYHGSGSIVWPETTQQHPGTFDAVPETAVCGPMRLVWYDDTNYTAASFDSGLLCPAIVSI
jgi:hypothetical protein